VYKTNYKTVEYDDSENQPTSLETIDIFKDGKLINSVVSPLCTQKWWYPEELKGVLEENGFVNVDVVDVKGKKFSKTSDEFIVVAEA